MFSDFGDSYRIYRACELVIVIVVIVTLPTSSAPGGGGFLVALLRDPLDREKAIEAVRKVPATDRVTFHTATVDR